jgi:hypothetical protein
VPFFHFSHTYAIIPSVRCWSVKRTLHFGRRRNLSSPWPAPNGVGTAT